MNQIQKNKLIKINIKEEKKYSRLDISKKFKCSIDEVEIILHKLIKFNIVNFEKSDEDYDRKIKFKFVGVIILGNYVISCYPKYISKCKLNDLKQVIKVIESFSNDEEVVYIQNDVNDNESINMLPLILFLIKDYYENGLYTNFQDILEHNGEGEILWEKTINNNQVIIQDNRPYYYDLITRNRTNDLKNYFRRLHKIILTKCSKDLEDVNLLNLFDLTRIDLTEETLDSFDDENNILNMINYELHSQFNTRKLELLKAMKLFISNRNSDFGLKNCFSLYGTTSFYHVWEKVCCHVFNDLKNEPLKSIPLPTNLNEKFEDNDDLMDIIEKPSWNILDYEPKYKDTFEPDLITITESNNQFTFYILDAKYYNIKYKNGNVKGQPGIESITKQYLYHLAFKEFIDLHNFDNVKNCFLFPSDSHSPKKIGFVELKMLKNKGLNNIQIILLPSKNIYKLF